MGRLFTLQALGVRLPPAKGHPNRVPFCGVLTKVDEPSTKPPGGGGGHRVLIPKALAAARLHTLIGMAVDCDDALENHEPQRKIGVITEATLDGNDLLVSGYLYEKDFPHDVRRIRARSRQGDIGMSFEIADVLVKDTDADIWELEDFCFTGAAILLRKTAAYERTAMVAAAATEKAAKDGKYYKTEAGKKFPASDYAYVPDRTKPSTWKLRLTSTPGGKPDPKIVGMAVAALGKGFRGNKVRIPAADRGKVKAKVRRAWRQAHPQAKREDMPEVLRGAAALLMEILSMADEVVSGNEDMTEDKITGEGAVKTENANPDGDKPLGEHGWTDDAKAEAELVAQVLSALKRVNGTQAFATTDDVVAAIARLYTMRHDADGKPPWRDDDKKDDDKDVEAGDESLDAAKMILKSMLQMVEEMQRKKDEEDGDMKDDEEPLDKKLDDADDEEMDDSEAEDDAGKERLEEELKKDPTHEDEDQDIDMLWRLLKKMRGQVDKRSADMADKATAERLGTLEKGFEKMQGQFDEVLSLLKGKMNGASDDKKSDVKDERSVHAEGKRASLTAGKEYVEYLQKYNIDASQKYTIDQVDQLLRQAGVSDLTTRGAIKHGLAAMGVLNGA